MSDRSEKPTEQRKKKARDDGDGVRSRELNAAFSMLGGLLTLGVGSQKFVPLWGTAYAEMLIAVSRPDWNSASLLDVARIALLPVLAPVAVVMLAAFLATLISGILQSGGVQFHAGSLAIKPSRLNPGSNLKHIASTRALVRLVKSLLPAGIILMLGFIALRKLLDPMPVLSSTRLASTFAASYTLLLNAAWIMVAWAGLDYAMEWRNWNQRLRMTKQEIRQEGKESSGDPQMKARIRQIQRNMRKQRVKYDISHASVVIMNPTHFAVALEFSFETMQAPRVLAKGRDLHALEMRDEARWAGVPIIENPPLARSLYKSVEVGRSIPFELYTSVAAILAYLYQQEVEQAARNHGHAAESSAAKSIHTIPRATAGGFSTGDQ